MQLGTLEHFPNYLPHIAAMLHFNNFLGRRKVTTEGRKENNLSSLESAAAQQQCVAVQTPLRLFWTKKKKMEREAEDASRIDGQDGNNLDMTHKGARYKTSNSDIIMF